MLHKIKNTQIWGYSLTFIVWLTYVSYSITRNNSETLIKYHLTKAGLIGIMIGYNIPILIIWFVILYAVFGFYNYSISIGEPRESKIFKYITIALAVFFFNFFFSDIINIFQSYVTNHYSVLSTQQNAITIIQNYLAVLVSLLAYWYLFKGASGIVKSINLKITNNDLTYKIAYPLIAFGVLYVYTIFQNPNRTISHNANIKATFALPGYLILLTIVLPYLVAWFFGFSALYEFIKYQKNTNGLIYKSIFKKLTIGFSIIIVLTVALQLFQQYDKSLATSHLNTILTVIILLILLIAVAFLLIGSGARQLTKIETVTTVKNK